LLFVLSLLIGQLSKYFPQLNEFIGAILGFAIILSGAPLGFLIAQSWYLYFFNYKKGNYYRGLLKPRPRKYMSYLKGVVIDNNYKIIDKVEKMIYIGDFLCHSSKDNGLKEYTSRRWDLMNMMGATSYAIILGLSTGFLIKLTYFNFLDDPFKNSPILYFVKTPVPLDVLIVLIGIIFIIIFTWGRSRIEDEHEEITTIMIKRCYDTNSKANKLMTYFDNSFFEKIESVK